MKINELFLESVRIPVNQKFDFGGIHYDNENGMGAVPFNSNVLYVGFAATMSAEDFIRLAAEADRSEDAKKFADMIIDEDATIACPFLQIEVEEDENASPNNPQGIRVRGHEGRGRAAAIKMLAEGYRKEDQKEPVSGDIIVHFFLSMGLRSRHLKEGFFEYLQNNPIMNEGGNPTEVHIKEIFHDPNWR